MSRPIEWLADTLENLQATSESVRDTMGAALRFVQEGQRPESATPMRGVLQGVMEVRADDECGTHRLMYAAKIGEAIYVLDVFQKKSKSGIKTPQADIARIAARYAAARRMVAAESKERQT